MGAIADQIVLLILVRNSATGVKQRLLAPALQKHLVETIAGEFEDLTQLDLQEEITNATNKLWCHKRTVEPNVCSYPLLEGWIKAVDSTVHQKMHAGEAMYRFRDGSRQR